MNKNQLASYRSMKAEIKELKERIKYPDEDVACSSVINDYRSGYPVPQAIAGTDWDKFFRIEKRCKNRIARLEQECADVERYIDNIGDSITRRIFRLYYLEGLSQVQIGNLMHFERSSVSRKINDYLKNQKD